MGTIITHFDSNGETYPIRESLKEAGRDGIKGRGEGDEETRIPYGTTGWRVR